MFRTRLVAILFSASVFGQTVPDAHFHHLHLNSTDPKAAIEFYTTKFDAEKAKFAGLLDAVWVQKSWILINKVAAPPPSEVVSTIWHMGFGAGPTPEETKATYQKLLDAGVKFQTPITDISDIAGGTQMGRLLYAYVIAPDNALVETINGKDHSFNHIHLLSENPVTAGEWYAKHFGMKVRSSPAVHRYRDVQIGPSASFTMDNVSFILYPMEYAISSHMAGWENRKTLEPTKGRVIDHIGISVDNLDDSLAKLKKEGVIVTDEPKSIAGGKIKYAFIEGPDKMRIEVIEGRASKD
jgi:catechol 2,3-dioxygenase-like lactoylglutathione lyase family enzyme